MTGYRHKSASESAPPQRPFNATQWIGLAILVLGALSIAVSLLGRIGAIPDILHDDLPLVALMPLGAVLMNARRQTAPCDPEVLRRRRIVIVILALVIAVAAAVLAFLLARGG